MKSILTPIRKRLRVAGLLRRAKWSDPTWPERNVTVEPLSGDRAGAVVRWRIFTRELTSTPEEAEEIVLWILSTGGTGTLPVPEYRLPLWGSEYRWTRAAHEAYERGRVRVCPRTDHDPFF